MKKTDRKKFIAVVGYANSGKSTIIKSLTGCKDSSYIGLVQDREINLAMFVHAPSPQEHSATGEKEFINYLKNVKNESLILGMVIAIQPTLARKRIQMDLMFSLAAQYGFECYAFILEYPYNPYRGQKIGNFVNIRDRILKCDPNAKVFPLDGRRFALLNADSIRSLSRIIG
jgi:predicted kinase